MTNFDSIGLNAYPPENSYGTHDYTGYLDEAFSQIDPSMPVAITEYVGSFNGEIQKRRPTEGRSCRTKLSGLKRRRLSENGSRDITRDIRARSGSIPILNSRTKYGKFVRAEFPLKATWESSSRPAPTARNPNPVEVVDPGESVSMFQRTFSKFASFWNYLLPGIFFS